MSSIRRFSIAPPPVAAQPAAQQQQQATQQQQTDLFKKGFAACLEPKGYTVKWRVACRDAQRADRDGRTQQPLTE